jgi:hypothetical protein
LLDFWDLFGFLSQLTRARRLVRSRTGRDGRRRRGCNQAFRPLLHPTADESTREILERLFERLFYQRFCKIERSVCSSLLMLLPDLRMKRFDEPASLRFCTAEYRFPLRSVERRRRKYGR